MCSFAPHTHTIVLGGEMAQDGSGLLLLVLLPLLLPLLLLLLLPFLGLGGRTAQDGSGGLTLFANVSYMRLLCQRSRDWKAMHDHVP